MSDSTKSKSENESLNHRPSKRGIFSWRNLLVAGVILTTAFTFYLGWLTVRSSRQLVELQRRYLEITRLQGDVVHMDEVLTMSARMAAATGKEKWRIRYREFEPKLDETIKSLVALQPEGMELAQETDTANAELVQMESAAFDLIQAGRRDEALALLESSDYETQKKLYAHGMNELHESVHGNMAGQIREHASGVNGLETALFFTVMLALAGWFYILQIVRRNRDLRKMNKRLDHQVQEQTQRLLQASKLSALGEMAGGVAHEINTPLSVIRLLSEQAEDLVTEDSPDKAKLIEMLQKIRKTTDRISRIVMGLKHFSREGRIDEIQRASVTNLLEDTFSLCSERFKNNGVDLTVNGEFAHLRVDCRPVEISQVLLNLLNNAFDAVEDRPQKWVKIDVLEEDSCLRISVTDSGSGVPPELKDKIMQPFFTTKPIGKGTGMGLSISRGIIEAHKGTLFIDSSCPNTRFTILLPKAEDKPFASKANQNADHATGR